MVTLITIALLFVVSSLSFFFAQPAQAATSSNLNFQARLSGSSGNTVADGNYSIQFKLYNTGSGGTSLWTETYDNGSHFAVTSSQVRVVNGYLTVNLGSLTAFPGTINWDQEHWLTMNVNGDGEMSPRLKLTAVPYAFRSGQADTLTSGSTKLTADDLIHKTPMSPQAFNSLLAAIRLNQTGTGGLLQLQGDGADVLTISKTGSLFTKGSIDVDGASVDIGTAVQQGSLIFHDGSSNTGSLRTAALAANRLYILPDEDGTICMQNSASCGFLATGTVFTQDGNSFGGVATLGTNDNFGLNFETNSTVKMTILPNGNVGIGTTNPFSPLHVFKNFNTPVAGTQIGQYFNNTYSVADTGQKYGTYTLMQNTHTSGTISQGIGNATITIGAGSGGTTTTVFNNYSRVDSNAGHTLGNAYNHYIASNIGTGTMTNQYGLFVADLNGATNNYAIYTAGSTNSYFGGSIGIGTVPSTHKLDVSGDINIGAGQTYKTGGVQISSANLSNDANLAKLNGTGPQTFTGNNKFTGTLLQQPAADSATAFEIQNAGGSALFTADTINGVVTIGSNGYLRLAGVAGDPAAPVAGDFWYSTTQKSHRLRAPIGSIGNGGLLCANTTVPTAISNTTALTDFGAETQCTLPANSLASGKVIRVTARGVYSASGLTAPTLNLLVRSGSTTLGNSGAVSTNINARDWGFTVEFDITVIGTGASGSVEGQGTAVVKTNAAQMLTTDMPNAGTVGLDTTVNQVLTLSAQWNAAAPGNTITLRQVMYEVLN